MLIGIKYCGGCNPEYDRSKFVEDLKKRFRGIHDIENVSLSAYYDVIVVVCGCTKRCASVSEIKSKNRLIFVSSKGNIDKVSSKLSMLSI